MTRAIFPISALSLACAALAAPVPDPFLSGWGNPVNLSRDCKISRSGGALTIEMPGIDHEYDPIRDQFNAPRLLREIEGDFEIRVRVRIDCSLSAQSTVKGKPSCVSAGFLLIYPETSRCVCDRMEYAVSKLGGKPERYEVKQIMAEPRSKHATSKGTEVEGYAVMRDWHCKVEPSTLTWDRRLQQREDIIWDQGWHNWPLTTKVESVYLKLEHRRNRFYFLISPDGEKWTQLLWRSGPPANLKLGLAAYSSSSEPSKVRFDQLWLSRGKKKERKIGKENVLIGHPVKGP